MSSYAAHASYMHVWAIASARATIGGPLRSDLLRRTSARAAAFQSATTVADADAAQTDTVTKLITPAIRRKGIGSLLGPVCAAGSGDAFFAKPCQALIYALWEQKFSRPIFPVVTRTHDEPEVVELR